MTWFTGICLYLTVWWTVVLAVLPMGVKSFAEAGIKPPAGSDPAAPIEFSLWRKCVTTTWVSTIIYLVIWAVVQFHLVHLPATSG